MKLQSCGSEEVQTCLYTNNLWNDWQPYFLTGVKGFASTLTPSADTSSVSKHRAGKQARLSAYPVLKLTVDSNLH